jgi:ATP-binding cassette, subfamily B, multidrug efflux pump
MIKLYRFLKPFKFFITIVLGLVFLQTLSDLYLPTLMSDIINKGIMEGDTNYIMGRGGLMLLITAGGTICAIIGTFMSSKIAVGLGRIIRNKVFDRVESFSLHEFDKIGTSTLITRTTNDITQVQMVTVIIMRMMISAPMMAIGGVILALQKDGPLTLVLAVAIPLLAATLILIAFKGIPRFKLMQTKLDKINLVLRENLTGIRVIRAFNRSESEIKRFDEANADFTDNSIKVNKIMAFLMPTIMMGMNLTTLAVLWFGALRVDSGDLDLGALLAFTQYAMMIMFSLLMVSMMFIFVPRAQAAAVRINEVLDTVPEINDPSTSTGCGTERGFVEFRDVTFSYHGAEQPAISNISFSAKPGEITAIIGGTGSGKSTMINLIPRFYDVDSGSVLVDGVDVREMTQECLRSKIGFVPQKTVLFSGSITDNLRYGKADATDEEIRHAAEIAQATEFISTMEDGFDHAISQGGTNVSGGQKQRLSIARALVRRPEIYIFDDSFSALDFKTDARLRAALKKEIADSTAFIISQRVSTVMDADRIMVIDEGKIVGMGTHKELIKTCEIYHEIVASQLSEEELA